MAITAKEIRDSNINTETHNIYMAYPSGMPINKDKPLIYLKFFEGCPRGEFQFKTSPYVLPVHDDDLFYVELKNS